MPCAAWIKTPPVDVQCPDDSVEVTEFLRIVAAVTGVGKSFHFHLQQQEEERSAQVKPSPDGFQRRSHLQQQFRGISVAGREHPRGPLTLSPKPD